MSTLKKLIRKSNQPLQQVVKRYAERTHFKPQNHFDTFNEIYNCKNQHSGVPLLLNLQTVSQFKILYLKNTEIKINNKADCYVQTIDKNIIKVVNICHTLNGQIYILGHRFTSVMDFYKRPLHSSKLCIYVVNELNSHLESWPVKNIMCKCMIFEYANQKVAFPLIHTYIRD